MDGADFVSGGLSLTPAAFYLALTIVFIISLAVGRLFVNSLRLTKAPPVFEGVPFLGGILKFAKVQHFP
jgi:hypothetical protein